MPTADYPGFRRAAMTFARALPFRLIVSSVAIVAVLILALGLSVGFDAARNRLGGADPALRSIAATGTARTVAERVVTALQQRLTQHPGDAAATRDLGLTYLQRWRETADASYYSRADAALNQAYANNPNDADVLIGLGALALERHKFQDALDWGERARSANRYRPGALGVIGDAQVQLGQYDAALDTIQQMIDLRPDVASYSRASYLRELQGDLPGAISTMRLAASAADPAGEQGAWTRVQLGDLLLKTGSFAEAEREYRWALVADPNNMLAIAALGQVHIARGDPAGAIPFYEQAAQRAPFPIIVVTLGDLYAATGRPDDAKRQYDLVRAIERLIADNGGGVDLDLALFEADHGDASKAVSLARSEVARAPNIQAYDALAWALYQQNDYPAAREASRQALRLGTVDSLMLFHSGMIDTRLGDRAGAITQLTRALANNPGFSVRDAPLARQTLTDLEAAG
jgi:tetratricopeptide (TPR) repeat protein